MQATTSLKIDQARKLSLELFLAYLDCYSRLSKDSELNKVEEFFRSFDKNNLSTSSPKTIESYRKYYTVAKELGIYYEENELFYLSKSAKLALNQSVDNPNFALQQYLQRYFFNIEFLINNQVIHPLYTLLMKFENKSFTINEVFDIDEFKGADNKSELNETSFKYLLYRMMLAGLLSSDGNNKYKFNDYNELINRCSFSKLNVSDFERAFIGSEIIKQKNIVTLIIDRKLENAMIYEANLNTIFYGPAGTGKTYKTAERAVTIIDGTIDGKERSEVTKRFKELKEEKQISFVTFHQSFSYEEFIEGISVTTNHEFKQTEYKIKDGIFKLIAKEAQSNSTKNYVLIIDEINRGNVSKIFGELITLLEPSKRLDNAEQLTVKLPYTQEEFGVPNNLYIIGTMNSSDRSLTALDVAMRRRFKFEELLPNTSLFKDIVIEGIAIQPLLEAINERIEHLIGRDYCIGHAYFTPLLESENQTFEYLSDIFENQILPLLQEYFYSDWEKIDLVLGQNQFIQKKELQGKSLRLFQDKSITLEEVWSINSEALKDSKSYQIIYKDEIAAEEVTSE